MNNLNPLYENYYSGSSMNYQIDNLAKTKSMIFNLCMCKTLEDAKAKINRDLSKNWFFRLFNGYDAKKMISILDKSTEENFRDNLKLYLQTLANSSYSFGHHGGMIH